MRRSVLVVFARSTSNASSRGLLSGWWGWWWKFAHVAYVTARSCTVPIVLGGVRHWRESTNGGVEMVSVWSWQESVPKRRVSTSPV